VKFEYPAGGIIHKLSSFHSLQLLSFFCTAIRSMALGSLRKSGVARSNREGILERLGTAYLLTFQRATFLDIVA
jgi:hypothetical protein